jgi:two-component system response regulator FixJ
VYLIDDDAAMRRSLAAQLAGDGMDVWPFASGAEFIAMIGHLRPSCILLDMEMPLIGGLDVLAELVRLDVDWPVIALSSRGELRVAVDAMKLGALDFLEKPLQREPLAQALDFAWATLERSLEAGLARQEAQARVTRLTRREADIALALMRGMANKSAAHELGISVRTVEMHRAHILEKLGVKSLAEAAVLMSQAGLGFGRGDDPNFRRRFALQAGAGRKASPFAPAGRSSGGSYLTESPRREPAQRALFAATR